MQKKPINIYFGQINNEKFENHGLETLGYNLKTPGSEKQKKVKN